MRKGQYLALESILSLSLGIAIAAGSITMFSDYRKDVLATGETKQADVIESKLQAAIYTLDEAESGHTTVDLPERIGGNSYTVSFNEDNIRIRSRHETYTSSLSGLEHKYGFSGSAEGGSVKVFKNGNEFVLRDE